MFTRGDMVNHEWEPERKNGVVHTVHEDECVTVQWSNGELVKYAVVETPHLIPIGWNLYAR